MDEHHGTRVAGGETEPFRGQAVEVGGPDRRGAVTAEILPAQVVGENDDHVRGGGSVPSGVSGVTGRPSDSRGTVAMAPRRMSSVRRDLPEGWGHKRVRLHPTGRTISARTPSRRPRR